MCTLRQVAAVIDREHLRRSFEVELVGVQRELLAFSRHLLWHGQDLEDILQNVLFTAFRRFEEFQPGTNFKAWIFQIATYEIFNSNRKYARERKVLVPWEEEHIDVVAELERETSYDDLLCNPDRLNEALDSELKNAIEGLSPSERAVLLLRILGGFSTVETSRMLDMPAGSVMGYLGRARRKLRIALADHTRQDKISHIRKGGLPS